MESSVTSLLWENTWNKEHLFSWLLFLLFLFYKAGRKYFLGHPKTWLDSSAAIGYCGVIALVPSITVTWRWLIAGGEQGGTWYADWKPDTLPSELFRKNALNGGGAERWGLFSLEESRVREGSSCCPPPPGRGWREGGARLFSEKELERTGDNRHKLQAREILIWCQGKHLSQWKWLQAGTEA